MIHLVAIALIYLPLPTPPPAIDPSEVRIEDAIRFGVSIEAAKNLSSLASSHGNVMRGEVTLNNDAETCKRWECEVAWRAECWAKLRTALDVNVARVQAWGCVSEEREPTAEEIRAQQLEALSDLLNLLGPADYHAGRMPPPYAELSTVE